MSNGSSLHCGKKNADSSKGDDEDVRNLSQAEVLPPGMEKDSPESRAGKDPNGNVRICLVLVDDRHFIGSSKLKLGNVPREDSRNEKRNGWQHKIQPCSLEIRLVEKEIEDIEHSTR